MDYGQVIFTCAIEAVSSVPWVTLAEVRSIGVDTLCVEAAIMDASSIRTFVNVYNKNIGHRL